MSSTALQFRLDENVNDLGIIGGKLIQEFNLEKDVQEIEENIEVISGAIDDQLAISEENGEPISNEAAVAATLRILKRVSSNENVDEFCDYVLESMGDGKGVNFFEGLVAGIKGFKAAKDTRD